MKITRRAPKLSLYFVSSLLPAICTFYTMAQANEASLCLAGEWVFPRLGEEITKDKLTKTQTSHLALLKQSKNTDAQKIAENPRIFAWLKFLNDFSVVTNDSCAELCAGSFASHLNNQLSLEEIVLRPDGGIPFSVAYYDKSNRIIESDDRSNSYRITISFGFLRSDKETALLVTKEISVPELPYLSDQKSGKPQFSLHKSKLSEEERFRKGRLTIDIVPANDEKLPAAFFGECGGFVRTETGVKPTGGM